MQEILDTFRKDLYAGQKVLVSGATSGIGLAIAQGFAGMGAEVVATGTSQAKLDKIRNDPALSGIRFEHLDVRDRAAIDKFVPALDSLFVLVNAAGIVKPDNEFNEDAYLEVIDVNMNSAMRLAMAAHPLLKQSKGAIINTASMLSYLADDRVPAYCASKTGIVGLTRALAHKFGPDGIRVNAIAPGYHKTAMTQDLWSVPEYAGKIKHRTALKRWGTVDDLVGTCLFLASPAALYVTGTTLPVDGGYVNGGW
ncbi:SDR family oxidoreductase [Rhizobium sophorae]|uniref:SDR family oxidoreductase n=1 Tax=Rhizobium sophorae TaxID=1535242 RepID=A0A7Y3S3A5_9HYPH|nr:SDR family oxidoreductase [Rhizobium sophorae]MBX4862870.1 SDR family oxidoreductase [Rhizobium bangladeshense]NKL37980.1 SDR family oxidoreductase [Rhizobium leguminosarum bv. viciae]NNU36259.1 SDR family oxidoreductase [Rhizobium sophorae]